MVMKQIAFNSLFEEIKKMTWELIKDFSSFEMKTELRQGCTSGWQQKLTLISCVVTVIFFVSLK